jgi:hypothetical protein
MSRCAHDLTDRRPPVDSDGRRLPCDLQRAGVGDQADFLDLPRAAGLLLEKLVTDRTDDKGERDLLVALGLLMVISEMERQELAGACRRLRPELRHVVRSNLTLLSLLGPRPGVPDPGRAAATSTRWFTASNARRRDERDPRTPRPPVSLARADSRLRPPAAASCGWGCGFGYAGYWPEPVRRTWFPSTT